MERGLRLHLPTEVENIGAALILPALRLDRRLNDNVDRSADQDQMLDIVAPHDEKPPATLQSQPLRHHETPVALPEEANAIARLRAPQIPGADARRNQNDQDAGRVHAVVHDRDPLLPKPSPSRMYGVCLNEKRRATRIALWLTLFLRNLCAHSHIELSSLPPFGGANHTIVGNMSTHLTSLPAGMQSPARPQSGLPFRLAAGGALVLAASATLAGSTEAAVLALSAAGAAGLTCSALGLLGLRAPALKSATDFSVDVETLPAAYALGDESGRILHSNAAFRAIFGLDGPPRHVSELAGGSSNLSAALFRLLSAIRHAHSASQIFSAEGKSGQGRRLDIAVHACAGPVKARGKGKMVIWAVSAREEQAVNAERPQALAVQLMLDALPLAAFLFDAQGQVVTSNAAFKRLAGLNERERATGHIANFLLRGDGQEFKALQWRHFAVRSGDKIVTLNRKTLPVVRLRAYFSQPPVDERVQAAWTLCVLAPESAAAAAGEGGYSDLLAAAPIAIASVRPDGSILGANPIFQHMFACGEAAVESAAKIADLVHNESREKLSSALKSAGDIRTAGGGEPISLDIRFGPEGERRGQLFLSPASKPKQLILYGIDTTAQHSLEEQVAHSQKMQAMGQLAGGIAHDFNNVLTAIIGFSDLLLARFRSSDPAFQDVMNIKNSANRAADLVRHLLAYSRRQTLRPRVLSLTDAIEDFNSSLGRLLGEKVKARIVHGRDLWLVKADESQLFQVIMNLSVNARDAMPQGGLLTIRTANITERESLTLKDRGIERGEYVLWEVSDTGTGITPDHLKKIFDPFFSTKEVGKGTGLGLSLVDGIIKQTGGSILVDSKLGIGTTFRIYLPRHQETEEEIRAAQAQASRKAESAAADLTGSGTVLLVEDEDAVRSFASRALATRGYHVLEAASGAEALEVMERQQGAIDLVVSDVVMPEMDGPTLLTHLRKKKPDIKIVFMSGYAEEAFRKNLNQDEKFFFLPKPFTLKKLAEMIKEATAA